MAKVDCIAAGFHKAQLGRVVKLQLHKCRRGSRGGTDGIPRANSLTHSAIITTLFLRSLLHRTLDNLSWPLEAVVLLLNLKERQLLPGLPLQERSAFLESLKKSPDAWEDFVFMPLLVFFLGGIAAPGDNLFEDEVPVHEEGVLGIIEPHDNCTCGTCFTSFSHITCSLKAVCVV